MGLLKEEILAYAARYISEDEHTDFPMDGDLFCLMSRALPSDRVLAAEEGWLFNGYGICGGYALDEDSKPAGKWLWLHFVSLATFPPAAQVLKLQPPHVVKGLFQSGDRSQEIRIIKVSFAAPESAGSATAAQTTAVTAKKSSKKRSSASRVKTENVVAFRRKDTPT